MRIKTILTLIVLCIITPHTYTMELELVPLHKTKKVNFIIDYDCPLLKLPSDLLDTIIFYNKPQAIGALKNSCKYLASLASLLRVNDQPLYQFIMPEERREKEERTAFFKRIAATDNAAYIEKIIEYGKREAHSYNRTNSIIILLNESLDEPLSPDTTASVSKKPLEQAYIGVVYLPFLLRYAIEQNKFTSVLTLTHNGADNMYYSDDTPLEYAARCDSDDAIQALFECNTFDENHINDAVEIAWFNNKKKALELLSTKSENNRYIVTLKKDRCNFIKGLTLAVPTGIFLVCILATGVTLQVLNNYCHKNATHHCF